MSLIRLVAVATVVVVAVWTAIPYLDSPEHRADSMAALKRSVTHEPDAPRKITVYQSTGTKGEAVFADARHDQGRGQAVVVDNSKGSSFHGAVPVGHDDAEQGSHQGVGSSKNYGQGKDPIAKMQREQLKFQQQAADLKQKQMDRIIGE